MDRRGAIRTRPRVTQRSIARAPRGRSRAGSWSSRRNDNDLDFGFDDDLLWRHACVATIARVTAAGRSLPAFKIFQLRTESEILHAWTSKGTGWPRQYRRRSQTRKRVPVGL